MAPRVGLFGILGSGNLGNDGSLDAVVTFLRDRHPGVRLDFMSMGPDRVGDIYDAPATALQWYEPHAGTATGVRAALLKIIGKLLDPFRTFRWVRRQDVVIVPGMGVLEDTLPMRPWAFPYSLFWLAVCARLAGTRVALVCVGASVVRNMFLRTFITRAARFSHYRSYRDSLSRDAMRTMGVDVSADEIYADLAFALPGPEQGPPAGVVGVGVMAYYGGNGDRDRADALHERYMAAIKGFVRHLVDSGRSVRLFTGDRADAPVAAEILASVEGDVVAQPLTTIEDLMHQMSTVDTVVATRYHNVLCGLKVGKPTLSIGYAAKNDVLMAAMGLGEFCQQASSVDLDRLIAQFDLLESRRAELMATLAERNRTTRERLEHQFIALSKVISGDLDPAVTSRGR
ncbi:MAG TPA: polysaccharide pyruvyl transferase family protein [Actinophytocola sp.]|jgi:polysaccharide pyruvyl transferase WcaK-like protein|nr:polysaccharide pyruvyl transferase family protein [Actinophytocola sp.]